MVLCTFPSARQEVVSLVNGARNLYGNENDILQQHKTPTKNQRKQHSVINHVHKEEETEIQAEHSCLLAQKDKVIGVL